MAFPETNITLSQICIAYGLSSPYNMSDLFNKIYTKNNIRNTVPSSGQIDIERFRSANAVISPVIFTSLTLITGGGYINVNWRLLAGTGTITKYRIKYYSNGNYVSAEINPPTPARGNFNYSKAFTIGNNYYVTISANINGWGSENEVGYINVL